MDYLQVEEGHYIFEYGDIGNHLFIVLQGTTEVQIPDPSRKREYE